jgi:UDP-N-acetylglucosamine acyltransferase
MSRPESALIHPTAIVSADADLAPDVRVGPYAIIDGPVTLGPGCVVGPHAHLLGRVVAGRGNSFGPGCVIGGEPQHLGYRGEDTLTQIGDFNIFREHSTIHRGMPTGRGKTVVGDHNLFMVGSHVAHDCVVGSHVIMANSSMLAGHVEIQDRAFLSGSAGVHQFCRVGRLALVSGLSGVTQDLPPFWIAQGVMNIVHGVNVVGMRRAGISHGEIQAVRRAFRTIHLQGLLVKAAVAKLERELPDSACVREIVDFIRASKRGIVTGLGREIDRDDRPELRGAA